MLIGSLQPWVASLTILGRLADETGIDLGYGLVVMPAALLLMIIGVRALLAAGTSSFRRSAVFLASVAFATVLLAAGLIGLRITDPQFGVFAAFQYGLYLTAGGAAAAWIAALGLKARAGSRL